MEEIIKILEEHNIKCVQNGNNLSLSHKNFYINVEDVKSYNLFKNLSIVELLTKKLTVDVYYEHEYIHITVI